MQKNYPSLKLLFCTLLLALGLNSAFAQSILLEGTVQSSDGEALPGVTVSVENTKNGTLTDQNGKFKLTAPSNGTLILSYIGFETLKVPINNRNIINITLKTSDQNLSEIVVVGYGQQTRKSLTSSITSIKSEDLNVGAISNAAQLLQGKVAGLNITRSGDPNARPSIILRGASTLREGEAAQPLFVIDGVIGADIATVAPDNIVGMDVLKDAAATAIYGSRAANGVIIVTTNRPKEGQTTATYKAYIASETVSNSIDMMSADQLRAYLKANNKSLGPDDDTGANTNWQRRNCSKGIFSKS